MSVLNAPPADAEGRVIASRHVAVGAVRLLRAPATNVCISSGYGRRNGRLHRGVDLHTRGLGEVLAAGEGVIRKAAWHVDFGNMIVIEHGQGVYTLYGHLAGFRDGVAAGASVKEGEVLGPIGMTGDAKAPHVHFEILLGAFDTPKAEFGMETVNPFAAPLS
jgi:murein DD-endopeptidase MepM/ murein hydrolase activator NlpD